MSNKLYGFAQESLWTGFVHVRGKICTCVHIWTTNKRLRLEAEVSFSLRPLKPLWSFPVRAFLSVFEKSTGKFKASLAYTLLCCEMRVWIYYYYVEGMRTTDGITRENCDESSNEKRCVMRQCGEIFGKIQWYFTLGFSFA